MSIAIGEDHLALAEAVRRFATDRIPATVTRSFMDDAGDGRPPFWDELASLGWLGLAVPEPDGGEGFGYAELAVVLDELGRAVAPGPVLPTLWAAALVEQGGGDRKPLADLATGRSVGSVHLGPPLAGRLMEGGGLSMSGTTAPVLCGSAAELLVTAVLVDGVERWVVVHATTATSAPLESLDPTRPLARLTFEDAETTAGAILPALSRARVEAIVAALAAAEAAGGARWCVDTASAYAAVRRQFGRPIGQFQGVKHRCADMLVAAEQAAAVAWDAAQALDGAATDEELLLTATCAGAVALDASVEVAKGCIQVLGGIGFTWEHDAHLYLRRATALRQLLGGAGPWRRSAATAALAGTRRRRHLDLPPEAEAVRAEVRTFAEEAAGLEGPEQRRRLAESGYLVPHWAPPWGRSAGAVEQLVIDQELHRAKVRVPHLQVGAWAAPTIAAYGTPDQQERWVGPTLTGEISWCQLFSEPEAGSDLAALTTAATRTDGGWLLNGQKVWTSMAKEADWGICLARTNPDAPKHQGITYFIVDMQSAGLDIRPLQEITGMSMFNEVFLDDVFVPDDAVIGEVDGGWPLARTTLANERVSMGSGASFGGGIESLLKLIGARVDTGRLVLDEHLLDQLGALVAEAHSLAMLALRTTVRSVAGRGPGPEASVRKLLGVEHDQRTQELGLTLLGPEGATTVGDAAQWTYGFLANRCLTIAGGTSEIQRSLIGERLLGLPRDPEPGR